MDRDEDRGRPEAWGVHVASLVVQCLLVLVGGMVIYLGIRMFDAAALAAAAVIAIGCAPIIIAKPWLWLPRSYESIATGIVDGQSGQVIPRRPPSILSALGLTALGVLVIVGGVAYAVLYWGDDESGAPAALMIGGVGGLGLLWKGWGQFKPANRTDLDLLLTAEGLRYKGGGESEFLPWNQIAEVEPISWAGGGRGRNVASGFRPRENLIAVRGPGGRPVAVWKCRSFLADPVEALHLLQRWHRDHAGLPR